MSRNPVGFYIGGSLADREEIRILSDALERTWWFENHAKWFDMEPVDQNNKDSLAERAHFDMAGIHKSAFGIIRLPAGYGTHVELGAFLALRLPVFLWIPDPCMPWNNADYKCVFHYHSSLQGSYSTPLAIMAELIRRYT